MNTQSEERDLLLPISAHVMRHGRPGVATVRDAVKRGEIKAVRQPTKTAPYLIRESEFLRWLASMSTAAVS